ncbi:MAG: hypothetical protein RJA63_1657 [Pseudomonadota bacterium]
MRGASFPTNIGYGVLYMVLTFVALVIIVTLALKLIGITKLHQRKEEKWLRSFMCLDCGKTIENTAM